MASPRSSARWPTPALPTPPPRAPHGAADGDRTAMARATRDLRYWSARRATAQLMERDPAKSVVQFGDRVTFEREDGRVQTFRIVGEDQADPAKGTISYIAPIARALLGKAVGEVSAAPGGEIEITAIA